MRRADNFTHLHVQIFLKYGSLKLLEPSGPVQACNGIAFTTSWRSYRKLKYSLELTLESTGVTVGRGQLKCDGTHAETRFRLSAKRTSPFKSAGEGGRQFSRLLAAEVCASAVVMLDTPCSEVV